MATVLVSDTLSQCDWRWDRKWQDRPPKNHCCICWVEIQAAQAIIEERPTGDVGGREKWPYCLACRQDMQKMRQTDHKPEIQRELVQLSKKRLKVRCNGDDVVRRKCRHLQAFISGHLNLTRKLRFLLHLDTCSRCWEAVYQATKARYAHYYQQQLAPRVSAAPPIPEQANISVPTGSGLSHQKQSNVSPLLR